MNGDRNDGPGGRRGRPRRAGVLAAAVAGIALLAAACGGGGSSAGSSAAGGSSTYQKALAYARCMRSHGEPSWPDPTSQGTFMIGQIDTNAPQSSLAQSACGPPPPGVHIQLSATQQQALLNQGLKYSACMRAHGITNFPDPDVQGVKFGGLGFSTKGLVPPGRRLNSPQFLAASQACQHFLGGGGS